MFSKRTALVKHLISAEHRCLTVLCPWCKGKTKTFTRVSDLEVHTKTSHPDLNIPKDRFTRSNGFYFAVYPKDYARIVENVQPYESDIAFEIRKEIRSWAEGFSDRKDRTDKWNRGWKEGLRLAEEKYSRAKSDQREEEIKEAGVERRSKERSRESSRSMEEKDTRKVIERKEKKRVEQGKDKETSKRRKERDSNEEERAPKQGRVYEREDSLDRYQDMIHADARESNKRKGTESVETTKRSKQDRLGSNKEDAVDNYRDDIEVGEVNMGGGQEQEIELEKECHDQEKDSGEVGCKRLEETAECMEGVGCKRLEETVELRDSREEVRSNGNEETDDVGKRKATGGEMRDKESRFPKQKDEEPRNKKEPESVTRGEAMLEGTITDTLSETSSSSSSSSSSESISPTGTPDKKGGDSLRARALEIIRRGAMPICPPAKRDWNTVICLDCSTTNTQVVWPPSNWKSLSADQKLMAREYMALLLENKNKMVEFPAVSRRTLLDKYAFFALDGEKRAQEEENEADKVEAKIRQYNLSYVTKVAKGEINDSRTSWSIIRSIEKADRWTDTDHITEILDKGKLKLKI